MRHLPPIIRSERRDAFTLIELLTATVVFSLILVVTLSVINQASGVWRRATDKIEAFQSARNAFDLVTQKLSQATLNTYLDYDDPNLPRKYLRKSDLQFASFAAGENQVGTRDTGQAVFFQAPSAFTENSGQFGGLESLLSTMGYYVEYAPDPLLPAHLKGRIGAKSRYRLMQLLVPAENNEIFTAGNGDRDFTWFQNYIKPGQPGTKAIPVADNIIAFLVHPQDPDPKAPDLAPQYSYNSRIGAADDPPPVTAHQLPPVIQVTMVAVDETSMSRLDNSGGSPKEIAEALREKFRNFSNYEQDLKELTSALSANNIQYRVFSSAVPIRESKWTK